MLIIKTKKELQETLNGIRFGNNKTTGFVPTMGYLHNGHLSLIEKSRQENDISIVSIFVNPAQFNDPLDFNAYPENSAKDISLCEAAGVDILFLPHQSEFYQDNKTGLDLQNKLIQVSLPSLTQTLCGPKRPGHFEGVLLIVARLFNIIQPTKAYFGKKDYQQFRIIDKMTKDLDFPIEIIGLPTFRESSGLAMSSRNSRLSEKGKDHASLIHRAILLAKKAIDEGKTNSAVLCEIIKDVIETGTLNNVEYVEIVDAMKLQPIQDLNDLQANEKYVIACAVYCEGVRLIDNMEFEVE